jgi:hypothetical protein
VDVWPRLSVLCCWMQAGPFNELTFRPRRPTKCWNKSQSLEELFSREAKACCGIQWLYDSWYTGLCWSMTVNSSLSYFLSGMIRLSKSAQHTVLNPFITYLCRHWMTRTLFNDAVSNAETIGAYVTRISLGELERIREIAVMNCVKVLSHQLGLPEWTEESNECLI